MLYIYIYIICAIICAITAKIENTATVTIARTGTKRTVPACWLSPFPKGLQRNRGDCWHQVPLMMLSKFSWQRWSWTLYHLLQKPCWQLLETFKYLSLRRTFCPVRTTYFLWVFPQTLGTPDKVDDAILKTWTDLYGKEIRQNNGSTLLLLCWLPSLQ